MNKKREHDRHSGTGRGKEISKGGAGGKFTWGEGKKNLEKEAYADEEEYDDEQYDDAEEKKEEKKKEKKKEEKKEEKKEAKP
ncbi:MAG: hypothetical protein MJ252_11865 [archaeon]|nr:hypothetical protein [archaeon]